MEKAVFLDRDGVINNEEDKYYIHRTEDFFLNEGIAEVLKELTSRGYLLIVITNQGGISKNFYGHEDVKAVHEKMLSLLSPHNIKLTEIYYCPHHSDNENCLCRKPKSIMIEKGIARFNIDPNKSWFIGDRDTDMEAATRAGLKTIKVEANQDMNFLTEKISE